MRSTFRATCLRVWIPLFFLGVSGCASGSSSRLSGPHGTLGQLPPDLPPDPQPCVSYCKDWVPPTYRRAPQLVQVAAGQEVHLQETVYELRAREVLVKPPRERIYEKCGEECTQDLVQVKPGGYRWIPSRKNDCPDGTCWQYCELPPEFRWCEKTVTESGIRFCMPEAPELRTVVETVPVQRTRTVYVPPRYEIRYQRELYEPGRFEWRATCSPECVRDPRTYRAPEAAGALHCDCPATN